MALKQEFQLWDHLRRFASGVHGYMQGVLVQGQWWLTQYVGHEGILWVSE